MLATEKLRIQRTHFYRSIGMLGKEMGYEISTCQMQYDANNKETDKKKIHASYTLQRKVLETVESIKYLGSLSQMICDGIDMSAIFTQRLIGPLPSGDEIFMLVHKR